MGFRFSEIVSALNPEPKPRPSGKCPSPDSRPNTQHFSGKVRHPHLHISNPNPRSPNSTSGVVTRPAMTMAADEVDVLVCRAGTHSHEAGLSHEKHATICLRGSLAAK